MSFLYAQFIVDKKPFISKNRGTSGRKWGEVVNVFWTIQSHH